MSTFEAQIIQSIKDRTRGLGLTQRDVAKEMNVSLPTAKRWWAGKGINFTVLSGLCSLLGLPMSQLFLELESKTGSYPYSLEQEKMLADNPRVLALLDFLVSGKNVRAVQRKYSLTDADLQGMLLKLDRVGIIELHANMRVKLKRRGEPQWINGGPLSLKYRRRMIDSLLGEHRKEETTFFIHDYLPEDIVLLRGKIRELENLMQTCNVRGAMQPEKARSYGSYFCLKPFEWDLRDLLYRK
jgi:transcriptional regulator with XRE-family HTH domain